VVFVAPVVRQTLRRWVAPFEEAILLGEAVGRPPVEADAETAVRPRRGAQVLQDERAPVTGPDSVVPD
jgi:hypothetical protein